MIFGLTEPVFVGILMLATVVALVILPEVLKKKNKIDYTYSGYKDSISFWHYAGVGGFPSYSNIKLSKDPQKHMNNRHTVWLEGIENPFTDVNMNEADRDRDVKVKVTADAAFGRRVDVYCRIDASGCRQEWDDVLVHRFDDYVDSMKEFARRRIVSDSLFEKEVEEAIKGDVVPVVQKKEIPGFGDAP